MYKKFRLFSLKKAIELKGDTQLSKDKKLELITKLKDSINSKRMDFLCLLIIV
jgi:hypothetical protein